MSKRETRKTASRSAKQDAPRASRPKGQYRVVLETLLILIGILITSYVIANFDMLQGSLNTAAVSDNFNTVANEVSMGIVTASTYPGSIVRIQIPQKITRHVYVISLSQASINVTSMANSKISVSKQIFNIGQVNRIINSQVVSSSGVVEIVAENGQIRIRRGI